MRIAIVNDVVLAVEALRRILLDGQQHQLAWIAADGEQAVQYCARDLPDLILMDLFMPVLGGIEATRRIMARTPCPILVVTADVNDNSSAVFEAMGAGALDAVNTPVLERPGAWKGANALLAKIDTIRRLVGVAGAPRRAEITLHGHRRLTRPNCLVTIGASAGGPAAIAKILSELPAGFGAPIVVVQHVDGQFAQGLATWLDYQTSLEVRLAREGDRPQPGTVLLAGGEMHLVFSSPTRLAYVRHPADCSYRPSIDVFFRSVARLWHGHVVGLLLTGMGSDGAEGLRVLRKHGYHTIAQDQATSAVYGMPKAAAQLGAATEVLPLDKIASRLTTLLAQRTAAHV
jgi:two-component system, chemotaxis family, response regulator WspF